MRRNNLEEQGSEDSWSLNPRLRQIGGSTDGQKFFEKIEDTAIEI